MTIIAVYGVFAQLFILVVVVSSQKCSDTVGHLFCDNSDSIDQETTYILADDSYKVSCKGKVTGWKFCYRKQGKDTATFDAGVWRVINETNHNGNISFVKINSTSITFAPDVGEVNACQTFNLSSELQFTVPEGSVVGLYSNTAEVFSPLLYTNSSIRTYRFMDNITNVTVSDKDRVNLSIAIELYLVAKTFDPPYYTLITTPSVVPYTSSNHDVTGIIIGCIFGFIICTIFLMLLALLLYHKRRQKKQGGGRKNSYSATSKEDFELESRHTTESTDHTALLGSDSNINYKSNQSTSTILVQQNSLGKDHPKRTCNDYIALHKPSNYATALESYSNLEKSFTYDYARTMECSEVSTNVEGKYLDPGHSKADICACFERKQFHIIKNEDVSILQKIGSGEFGTVHHGEWYSDRTADPIQVAVKTLNSDCSESEKVKFLREAAIMGQFEDDHIVKLHGVVTEIPDVMIVLELMPRGDLREFLLELKEIYSAYPGELAQLKHSLLSFCKHISAGLSHLSYKGFVHRDLAARNILVSSDNVCKIADFGMARDVADDTYYVIKGGKIPVKWTPPEAIFYRRYSTQSDVWSFGCVMYEIWSLGHKPFEDDDGREYINKITTGYRLPPPPGCPRVIYELMIQCWHPIANQRVSSNEIVRTLESDRILLPDSEHDEEESTILGDPLGTSSQLYLDLQQTYYY